MKIALGQYKLYINICPMSGDDAECDAEQDEDEDEDSETFSECSQCSPKS